MSYRLKNHRSYPVWFLVISAVVIAISVLFPQVLGGKPLEVLISILGAAAGAVYFFYNRHLSQTQFFHILFTAFNKRYDDLNGSLDKIHSKMDRGGSELLTAEERHTLYDYFNLCAEEHLYHEARFIDEKVWKAWREGMAYFYKVQSIGKLWENDLSKSNSFYGFDLTEVRRIAGVDHR